MFVLLDCVCDNKLITPNDLFADLRMTSQMLLESDRSEVLLKGMKDVREGGLELCTRKAAQK